MALLLGFYCALKLAVSATIRRILTKISNRSGIAVQWNIVNKTDTPLDGDPATIRNFGQNSSNRSRNGKSAVERIRPRCGYASATLCAILNYALYALATTNVLEPHSQPWRFCHASATLLAFWQTSRLV